MSFTSKDVARSTSNSNKQLCKFFVEEIINRKYKVNKDFLSANTSKRPTADNWFCIMIKLHLEDETA